MTSTKNMQGYDVNSRNSSRVMQAPGGASNDIFGTGTPATRTPATRAAPTAVIPPYAAGPVVEAPKSQPPPESPVRAEPVNSSSHEASGAGDGCDKMQGKVVTSPTPVVTSTTPVMPPPTAQNKRPTEGVIFQLTSKIQDLYSSLLASRPADVLLIDNSPLTRIAVATGMKNPITGETFRDEPAKPNTKVVQPPGGRSSFSFA